MQERKLSSISADSLLGPALVCPPEPTAPNTEATLSDGAVTPNSLELTNSFQLDDEERAAELRFLVELQREEDETRVNPLEEEETLVNPLEDVSTRGRDEEEDVEPPPSLVVAVMKQSAVMDDTSEETDEEAFAGERAVSVELASGVELTSTEWSAPPLLSNAKPNMPTVADFVPVPVLNLQSYAMGPSPVSDLDDLRAFLPTIAEDVRPLSKVDKIRQVLVLGSTGHLGRWLVRFLGTMERPLPLVVHCIVRANKQEVANTRLRTALESMQLGDGVADTVMAHTRVWRGDVTKELFGMDETEHTKLLRRVEAVYVAVGPDLRSVLKEVHAQGSEAVSLYGHVSGTAVLFWRHVLEFAATYRLKHIYTATPLFMSMQLLEPPRKGEGSGQLVESDGNVITEQEGFSPHGNFFGCQAWCKNVVEALLSQARKEREMSITVFRIPPLSFFASGETDLTHRLRGEALPVAWAILRVVVRLGLLPDLPDHFFTLFCHPADEAIKEMVNMTFCRKRLHSTYNMINHKRQTHLTRQSFTQLLSELGIFVEITSPQRFAIAAAELGDLDLISALVCQDIGELGRMMNESEKTELTIASVNYQQDRQLNSDLFPDALCDNSLEFVQRGLLQLLHKHFFPADSLGTLNSVDACKAVAISVTGGLSDFNSEDLELLTSGWSLFLSELNSRTNRTPPKFVARCVCARNLVVYLTTLLYMRDREKKCPEILNVVIESPLFIVGLNRAGTTLLHQMLGRDHTRNRCPTWMEMVFPYGTKGDYQPVGLQANEPGSWMLDPRKEAAMNLALLQYRSNPVENNPTAAAEDSIPFDICGRSFNLSSAFCVPRYREWLIANHCQELRRCYALHKRMFQHLQYQRPGKRWIFKLPWHLFTMDQVLTSYPEAEIVFVHRRPLTAVQSYCVYEQQLQSHYLEKLLPDYIGRSTLLALSASVNSALDVQEEMAMAFVQQHPTLQPPQSFFLNLYFDEFISNPTGSVALLYELLQVPPLTVAAEKAMWNYLQDSTKLKEMLTTKVAQDLSNFCLSKEEVKTQFARYTQVYFSPDQRLRRKQEYKVARAIRGNSVEPKTLYDAHGSIVMDGRSWIDRAGLTSPMNNMEVLLSYARTRFIQTAGDED